MTDATDAASETKTQSRRAFLRDGSTAAATVVGAASVTATTRVHAAESEENSSDVVNLALVGCGSRGGGAVRDNLSGHTKSKVVALADIDPDKPSRLRGSLKRRFEDRVAVEDSRLYDGVDAYQRVVEDPRVDAVLFATPPGFRPSHILAAVKAGKHVFAEKPSCVDVAGYRTCLEAERLAREQGTSIVTGTQYRRQENYIKAVEMIHDGAIGDIVSATARYCANSIWYRARKPEMTDTEYQIYNWMHFIWLSGDQIAEQAVHNIDFINWVMDGPPELAFGSGGRFTRPQDSEMWDNMAIDYVYPGDRLVSFMCRQIPGAKSDNANVIRGTEGTATIYGMDRGASIVSRSGEEVWSMPGDIGAAYRREHKDLVDSILDRQHIVELKQTADSSLTAVLGRVAAYTGQRVTWDFLVNESKQNLFPEELDLKSERPPSKFAVPGKTPLV